MKSLLCLVPVMSCLLTAGLTSNAAGNPIVRENQQEGSTNWLVFNYDQVIAPGRDELWKREKGIEGFWLGRVTAPGRR
jgi:hypothetical protein